MRSDPIDQVLSSYLKLPVKASWEGSAADTIRGSFAGPSLELAGVATAWLPLDRVCLTAEHASFTPGIPPHIAVIKPRLSITVGQEPIDDWVSRFRLPFRLLLGDKGLRAKMGIAGFPVGELETKLEVVGGWFVLQPRKASVLGVPAYVATLFRTYLPLPPLPEDAKLVDIAHRRGELELSFEMPDFEEAVTPGLVDRLKSRLPSWAA